MNDELLFNITTKYRQIIKIMDLLHFNTEKMYKKYFNFVYKCLENDFENTDKIFSPTISKIKKEDSLYSKKIWVMWWQGYNSAPSVVKSNIVRMKNIFGSNNVILITKSNFKSYTNISPIIQDKFYKNKITFTSWSDIVRFNLLKNHGGVWVDSTVVLSKKILDERILEKEFFSLCSSDEYQFVSNGSWTGWMIGGICQLGLFNYVNTFYEEYFKKHNSIIDYYIVDYVIYHYFLNNDYLRELINNEKRSWKNYEFMNHLFSNDINELVNNFNTKINYSVQKITYKKKIPPNLSKDSLYNLIIEDKI